MRASDRLFCSDVGAKELSDNDIFLNRRTILKGLSGATAIGLSGYATGIAAACAAPVARRSALQNEFLAWATVTNMPVSSLPRADAALAVTYELSARQNKGPASVALALQNPNLVLVPSTFDAAKSLAANKLFPSDQFTYDSDYWSKLSVLTVQSAAAVGTIIAPEIAIPLSLLSIWAEPAMKYLGSQADAFMPTSDVRQQSISQFLYAKALEASDSSDQMRAAMEAPTINSVVRLNISASNDDIAAQLPDEWRSIVKKSLNASDADLSNPAFLAPLQQAIEDQMKRGYKKFSDKIDEIKETINEKETDAARAQERQRQRQNIAEVDAEMVGSVAIAGFVAARIFHDSMAAQKIFSGGNAVRQVYSSVAKFAVGDIGALALSGGLLSAADTIMGLFGGGPDPIRLELQNISSQLEDIRKELGVIEHKEDQILQALSALYSSLSEEIRTGIKKTDANFATLEELISVDFSQAEQDQRDTQLKNLVSNKTRVKDLLRDNQHDHEWYRELSDALDNVHDFAVYTAANAYYSGTPGTFPSIVKLLDQEPRADLFFGVIPSVCDAAKIGYRTQFKAPTDGTRAIPNPIAWAFATRFYLQMSSAYFDVAGSVDEDQLTALWNQGLRVREAAQIFSSSDTVTAFSDLYCQYGGIAKGETDGQDTVLSVFKAVIQKFCDDNEIKGPMSYSFYDRHYVPSLYPPDASLYEQSLPVMPPRHDVSYVIVNDPLSEVVHKKLVAIDSVTSNSGNGVSFTRTYFQFPNGLGPLANQKFHYMEIQNSQTQAHSFSLTKVIDDQGHVDAADILPIIDEANKLLRVSGDWPIIVRGLSDKLIDHLDSEKSSALYASFLWAANVLRWAGTIAVWRRTPDSVDSETAARLENVGMPSTIENYKTAIYSILSVPPTPDEIPRNFDWPTFLGNRFAAILQKGADMCLQAAAGLPMEQGIPEVDETLKMLGGYMKIHNIPAFIPAPLTIVRPAGLRAKPLLNAVQL